MRSVTQLLACLVTTVALASSTPLSLRRLLDPAVELSSNPRSLEEYLLPQDVIPLTYDVTLIPYFETPADKNFTFDGKVLIEVVIARPTRVIQMHANDIDIANTSDVVVTKVGGDPVPVTGFSHSGDDKHFLTIDVEQSLELGARYIVAITYVGKLNDDLEGFYRSSYIDGGVKKWMGVTQFESTGARRAFPCFDEPAWKANFTMHIAHAPEHTVLSNMPAVGDTPLNDTSLPEWNITNFETSVLMSSYLVAFTVSEFVNLEHPFRKEFNDWARPSLVQYAEESNNMAPKVIDHMTAFTGIGYPLPKMDQIAIPDFAAGAMENWGLVTYRESAMLYVNGTSTTSNLMGVSSIVAHELAHQWFGNLVSPKWWSSIWLNEGFATYFSYDVLNAVYPDWDQKNAFVQGEMHYAFSKDGLESTHPLLVYADSPSSTGAVFDTIAYSKGACIVHMIRNIMGEANFRAGINAYLIDRMYNSADKDDLWRGLQTAIPAPPEGPFPEDADLKTVMDTWVVQAGYPVVTFTRDYDANTASVDQERFLTLRTEPSTEVWWIPLTMTSQDAPDFTNTSIKTWHNGTSLTLNLTATSSQWLLANVMQVGYYRVNYDTANWALLTSALNSITEMVKISELNRAQVMDDALALARAALLDYTTALDTTSYLDIEDKYTPWNAALSALSYIYDRLAYEDEYRSLFSSYVLDKLDHMYELVGGFTIPETEVITMKKTRSLVLSWTCKLENQTCNDEAATLFQSWQEAPTNNPIAPDLKSVTYCSGMRAGGQEEYDFLFTQYEQQSERPAEQSLILSALGCSSDTNLLQSYLNESIAEESKIRAQDARSVLSAVYNNYLGVDLALDFLLTNYDRLLQVYNGLGTMQGAFSGISVKLNTQEHRDKLQAFRDDNETQLGTSMLSAVDGALKTLDETLAWQSQHRDVVLAYFRDQVDGAAGVVVASKLAIFVTLALSLLVARL